MLIRLYAVSALLFEPTISQSPSCLAIKPMNIIHRHENARELCRIQTATMTARGPQNRCAIYLAQHQCTLTQSIVKCRSGPMHLWIRASHHWKRHLTTVCTCIKIPRDIHPPHRFLVIACHIMVTVTCTLPASLDPQSVSIRQLDISHH